MSPASTDPSIRLTHEFYELVRLKAKQNRRSIVKELEVLIEEACEYEKESHERAQRELNRRRK